MFVLTAGCVPKQPVMEPPRDDTDFMSLADVATGTASEFSLFRTETPFELVKPAQGPITSPFGMRKHPTKRRKIFHRGVDINAKRGSPVVAAAPGVVTFTGSRGRGYGKTIEIRHDNGMLTRYAHLDTILVKVGDRVTPDLNIGRVGRTGRTTGPNLHLELLAGGKTVNPVPFWSKNPWRKASALVQQWDKGTLSAFSE